VKVAIVASAFGGKFGPVVGLGEVFAGSGDEFLQAIIVVFGC